MLKKQRRVIIGVALVAAGAAAYVLFGSRLSSLLPKAAATGDEVAVAPKTLVFGVDATGLLRATAVQNFGGPPMFADYWQFQIVNLVAEGKQVKAGEQLITFDALNEVEEDRLAFEQASREVAAIKDRLEWHKKSSEATYQIIASKKSRAENKVNEIKKGMENFQAKADRDGVVIYKTKWNGDKFRVGENVWMGQSILEIPDLNTIIAEAYVPEVDIGKVKMGQRAEVTIDAFPDKVYSGSVKSVGKLVRPKAWDIPNKILDIQIALDHLDISIMRPAMSVKAKVETSSVENCLAVPLKAVRTTAEGSMVKVKSDQGWREQRVKLGESNGTEVVILEGLKAGDRIGADFAKAK